MASVKSTSMSADEYKWKVQDAANSLIQSVKFRNEMKKDSKFKKDVQQELKKRIEETKSAVTATQAAMK